MMTKEEFQKWADKACRYCYNKAISNEINLNFYAFQSEPLIDKQPELLILALHPSGNSDYWDGILQPPYEEAVNNFSKGNVNYDFSWRVLQGLQRVFKEGNIEYIFEDGYPYMFMNCLYFNANKIQLFKNRYDKHGIIIRENIDLTAEFIQLLKPKRILCLSIVDCFDQLKDRFTDCRTLVHMYLAVGKWNNIPVYGIRHPAFPHPGEKMTGKALKYMFDKDQQQSVSTEEFLQVFTKEIEDIKQYRRFQYSKEQQIKIVLSTKDLIKKKLGLTEHRVQEDTFYTNNKKLYITVTQVGRGRIAIRHSNYVGSKRYTNIHYEKQEELFNFLSEYGYKKDIAWLGVKPFKLYGFYDRDVPYAIVAEIEKLLPLLDEITN